MKKCGASIFTVGIAFLLAYDIAEGQFASDRLVRDQRAVDRPRPDRGETVANRQRPELDPLGMRAATFLVYPRLRLQEAYNDNIFAADGEEKDDFITIIRPRLDVRSDWNNHALNLRAEAAIGRHINETDEDFEDFSVGLNGRLDITRRSKLRSGVSYNRLHEGRGSPDDVLRQGGSPPVEPTVLEVGSAFLTYSQLLGRFLFELDGAADRLAYDDVRTEDGGTIDNDDRDRSIFAGGGKIGYEVLRGYTAFIRGAVDYRRYKNLVGSRLLDRDSEGFVVEVGTDLDFTSVLFGEVAIGYRSQDYDDPRLETVDGVAGGAELIWTPTGLTTVTVAINRQVVETTASVASGIFSTTGRLVIDHELLRNLLLQARVSVIDDDFRGIDRSDTYVLAGFGANYLMNRHIYLDVEYDYVSRGSDAQNQDFTDNVISVGVRLQI